MTFRLLRFTPALEFFHIGQVVVLRIVGEGPQFKLRPSHWLRRKNVSKSKVAHIHKLDYKENSLLVRVEYIR